MDHTTQSPMPTQLESEHNNPHVLTLERLVSRSNEDFPFEDEFGKFFLTIEHFYQHSKFASTDPIFSEHIRLAGTAEEAKKLSKNTEHPSRDDWKQMKDRFLEKAFELKLSKSKAFQELLISTDPEELHCEITDCDYRLLQLVIQKKQFFVNGGTFDEKTTQIKRKAKRNNKKKKNIYNLEDGTVTFDMVSSDSVRVCVTAEDIVIPMSALPPRAKTAAKNYQYYKKNHPESVYEESDEEKDDDEVDSDCEEYIFHRETKVSEPILTDQDKYSQELLTLIELGFTDCDANYAALVSAEGSLEDALDYLSG